MNIKNIVNTLKNATKIKLKSEWIKNNIFFCFVSFVLFFWTLSNENYLKFIVFTARRHSSFVFRGARRGGVVLKNVFQLCNWRPKKAGVVCDEWKWIDRLFLPRSQPANVQRFHQMKSSRKKKRISDNLMVPQNMPKWLNFLFLLLFPLMVCVVAFILWFERVFRRFYWK